MELDMSRAMGAQDEAIATLKREVALLRADVAEIKDILASNRGGVRTLVTVALLAASLGGGVEAALRGIFK